MTPSELISSSPVYVDVTWDSWSLDPIPSNEVSSSFILSQAIHVCGKPDFDKSHKLFGLNQKAPSWAFFSLPPESSLSSQRCFQNGQILNLNSFKGLDDLSGLDQTSCKEIILKCLSQLQHLNKISEDLYKNIFKFQKS